MTVNIFPEILDGLMIESPAERLLFEEFKEQLSNHFFVYHSISWLGIRRKGRKPSDGEIDFIIMHPKMGILLIEVKGGIIGFDERNGYYSQRRDKRIVDIKNPFNQVKSNKYALRDLIKTLPNWPGRVPTLGHAVAFPDGSMEIKHLGLDAKRAIVLMHEDRTNLEEWVRNCFVFWSGEKGFIAPTEANFEVLKSVFRKSWLMREPKLGELIPDQTKSINRYTDEQFNLLGYIRGRKRALIKGCAGSGKTILATEKAHRLAQQGFRTLLTCYNRNLADHLQKTSGQQPRLKIQTFHGLCAEYVSRAGLDKLPEWDDSRRNFFDEIMPEMMIEAITQLEDVELFDAIIIDEGQDFSRSWWPALESLLNDLADGIFYIFYDDNQKLYNRKNEFPIESEPFPLTTNCRNTREIHDIVKKYYQSELETRSSEIPGRPVEIHTFGGGKGALRALLTRVLSDLVFKDKVEPKDIVVLSPGGLKNPPMSEISGSGAFTFIDGPARRPDEILSTSIRLYKGLEAPVIVLILPNCNQISNSSLYVGLSRASIHLIIILDIATDSALLNQIGVKHEK